MSHLLTQSDILAELAPTAASYLEVGVQEGKSLRIVLAANPGIAELMLCDTWGSESGGSGRGSHTHVDALLTGWQGSVTYLDGDSRDLLPLVDGEQRFDLVHIDGGHSYDTAASDLRHGWRLCRHWLVVHDISFFQVWRAFYRFIVNVSDAAVECYFGGHGTAVMRRTA